MGKNLRKTPSRGGKWKKFSEKRFPAAGKGKNRSKNAFVRREGGKIFWRSVSRHGKWGFFAEKRFPPREGCFLSSDVYVAKKGRSTMRNIPPQKRNAANSV